MASRVERTETLSPELKRHFFGWSDHVFGADGGGWVYLDPSIRLITRVDGMPVSHVGLVRSRVRVADAVFEVIGVGCVVTPPPHQGKGHAAAALAEAAREIRADRAAAFGLLFCRERLVPFYGRQGWEPLDAPVTIDQPSGRTAHDQKPMVLRKDRPWPPGPVDILGLPW